jgi:hypothetical protein
MEDRVIIEYSFNLLIEIVLFNQDLLKELLKDKARLQQLLLNGLFCTKSNSLRKHFAIGFTILCYESL